MTATNEILLLLVLSLVVLIVWLLASARNPRSGSGGTTVVVRCLAGHVYATTWAARTLRFGAVRWRYCPVGEHWTLVTPVRREDLTPGEWRMARQYHDDSVR